MKTKLLVWLLLLSELTSAQFTFERSYQFYPNTIQNSSGIIEDGAGGFYITSNCTESNYTKAIISHLNSVGDTLWNTIKRIPNVLTDPTYCGAIIKTQDGNLLVHGNMGDTTSIFQGGHWLMKLDTLGNLIWFNANFNSLLDYQYDGYNDYLTEFNNKNILLYITNGFFAIFDSSGTFISAKYPSIYNKSIGGRHHNIKKSNSYFIFHGKKTQINYNENKFFKVNFIGDTISSIVTAEDSSYDGGMSYSKFNENWFYIVGRENPISQGTPSGDIITKLDSSGNIIWRRRYRNNFSRGLTFTSIKETPDTGLIVAGFKFNNSANYKPYLFKVNINGDSLWYREFGNSSNFSLFYNLINTSDGGFAIVGETTANGSSYSSSYIVKTDGNGIILNALDELKKKNQTYLHLYPNPANDYTNLHYMGTEKNVLLSVCNLQGQVIYKQKIEDKDSRINLNTAVIPAGLYFCSIHSASRTIDCKKLIVMH
jgi:Secretion system C-terminal sorting domain